MLPAVRTYSLGVQDPGPSAGGRPRLGLTLMELLVVVTILLMVAFIALPALAPSKEGRQVREAARSLNVMFGAARSQAMETGRPVGIWFERLYGQPQVAMSVFQGEVPPSYSGEDMDSTVRVRLDFLPSMSDCPVDEVSPIRLLVQPFAGPTGNLVSMNRSRIRVGDLIRFNQQGALYQVIGPGDKDGNITTFPLIVQGSAPRMAPFDAVTPQIVWTTTWSSPVPFEVIRQPVRSAGSPLELPAGVVVELGLSGTDSNERWFTPDLTLIHDPTPVIIMFSPGGSVDRVYCRQVVGNQRIYGVMPVHERLYLLIGQRDRILVPPFSDPPGQDLMIASNLANSSNLWLSINVSTGLVAARELDKLLDDRSANLWKYLWWSRRWARSNEDLAGSK